MSFNDTRLNINDTARLLGVRTSELKTAIQENKKLRGVVPPRPMRKAGAHGWVFRAGDVMEVAAQMGASQ